MALTLCQAKFGQALDQEVGAEKSEFRTQLSPANLGPTGLFTVHRPCLTWGQNNKGIQLWCQHRLGMGILGPVSPYLSPGSPGYNLTLSVVVQD